MVYYVSDKSFGRGPSLPSGGNQGGGAAGDFRCGGRERALMAEARASERVADIQMIEEAAAAGDFERAIELRDALRLSSGRQNSVHQMSAEL